MKTKYVITNLKMLLILPLLAFMMTAFGDCQGQLRFGADLTAQRLDPAIISATRADITFSVPSGFTHQTLYVYAQLWTDQGASGDPPVLVGEITNISPGATVTYTVPGLVPVQNYRIYLVPPATGASSSVSKASVDPINDAVGTVFLDTAFRIASSQYFEYAWLTNLERNGTHLFGGGFNEQINPAGDSPTMAFHDLSSSSLISPFDIVLVTTTTPPDYNYSPGQTSVMYDFNGDGALEIVIGDPYWGNAQIEPRCGKIYYIPSLPTSDVAINTLISNIGPGTGVGESPCGPTVSNQLTKNLTYDPNSEILIAGCPGCDYADAPCANSGTCGACALYDMSSDVDGNTKFEYFGLIQKRGTHEQEVCGLALFIDLDNDDNTDLVYQRTDEYNWPAPSTETGCAQLYYVEDGMTAEGVEIFTQSSGCDEGPVDISKIDMNQDGIDDLAVHQYSAAGYDLTVILGSDTFNPSTATQYNFTASDVGYGGLPVIADFDNDGADDFTIISEDSWLIWLDAATADFTSSADYNIEISSGLDTDFYDVNGDGYMDLIRTVCNPLWRCEFIILY